eukprot:gene13728-16224_t
MAMVASHNTAQDCWVAIHGKAVDVTGWRDSHPGGAEVLRCGTDLTARFEDQHGDLGSLESRAAQWSPQVVLLGDLEDTEAEEEAAERVAGFVEYDFSQVTRQTPPGSGEEFKTLIYLELKGGWDSAAVFVNVKSEEEIHLWCSKRPTLSAAQYCECLETGTEIDDNTGQENEVCGRYALLTHSAVDELNAGLPSESHKKKLYPMTNTEDHLAMTDLLAGESSTSWLTLWDSGDMAVVPGVGRFDHERSHFEVKDAAAKGVSTTEEPTTRHGWLAKSIFAFNSLYCQWGESEADCHKTANRTRMVDGISLVNSAAGPNALEVSDSSISGSSFLHISGVNNVDAVLNTELYNYDNPFVLSADDLGGGGRESSPDSSGQGMSNTEHPGDENDGDDTGTLETNHALEDLLDKESTTFHGIGALSISI